MDFLKVKLWGKEIGRLVWQPNTRRTYFVYNPDCIDDIPDISPLMSPISKRKNTTQIYGDDQPMYQGLPPFIADSLPDSWGNTLFDRWIKDNKVPRGMVTPLYKLMFIGTRGMGALEYEPCAEDLSHTQPINIKSLYEMSLKILEDRENILLSKSDELTLQALLAVGTSPGGRQMKAVIAINDKTGEIRSGQSDCSPDFEYYILKFGSDKMPLSEIETTYHQMALKAGIVMEECRLFPIEGTNHFLTKRFDRKNGRKIHMQTLAAICPEASSYEDLILVCRQLNIDESEIEQVYCRLVFNVMANNTDDHNKNFSFLLSEGGKWQISPAYDMTFIFNKYGTGPHIERRMSVNGKIAEITKEDLLEFARQNDIKNAGKILDSVADTIKNFSKYAKKNEVSQPWRGIIQKTINDTLRNYGYNDIENNFDEEITCHLGHIISELSIRFNSKGYFEISAIIDGRRQRRFVRPQMPIYKVLMDMDISNLSANDKKKLIKELFE